MPWELRPSRWPVRWLMAGACSVTLLATLLLMGLTLHLVIGRQLLASNTGRLLWQARVALNPGEGSRPPLVLPTEELPRARRMARTLGAAGVSVRLLNGKGETLCLEGPLGEALPVSSVTRLNAARQAVPDRDNRYVAYRVTEPLRGRKLLIVVVCLDPYTPGLYAELGTYWGPYQDILDRLTGLVALSVLIALALGVGVSLWFSSRISEPLENLAVLARRVAAGDLTARSGMSATGGEIAEVTAAFDDMVAQLEASFAAQRRFVADASHELRTPLTAIGGMAEMLRDASPQERERALGVIEREVDRLTRLVEDLLELSRAEQSDPGLRGEDIDLREVLTEAVDTLSLTTPGRALELEAPHPLPVRGSRDQLLRAVRNVLENALKFAPADAPVKLRATASAGRVTVDIRDQGPGIPPQDLPRVFERFFRADPSRARHTGGSGLGLSIVRAILEAHGGGASIQCPPGQGTVVTLHLPESSVNLQESSPSP